jgi:hypothetical protein
MALETEYKNMPAYRGGRKKVFEIEDMAQRIPRVWAEDKIEYPLYSIRWESSCIPVYFSKSRYCSVSGANS